MPTIFFNRMIVWTFIAIIWFINPIPSISQKAVGIPGVSITVSDLDKILPFYQDVLDFELLSIDTLSGSQWESLFGSSQNQLIVQQAVLRLGTETIELIDFLNPADGNAIPTDSRSNDLWFQHIAIVTNDMDAAYKRLLAQEVEHVSTAPQTLPEYLTNAAGIKAFYFRDPDGHNLEIIYFPPGKGNPKWQQIDSGPFIGIDHTAIGISKTKKSLAFYKDLLGFEIAGTSENYGSEQEHLNQVFGARLMITGLTAGPGIGLEFLDYIAPPGGRIYPINSNTYDLWHWHTTLYVTDIESLYQQLTQQNYTVISNGIISLNQNQNHGHKACMVRDPDGHALLLLEQLNQ